jgi:hypothetical protein
VAWGMNTTTINDGIVATVAVTLSGSTGAAMALLTVWGRQPAAAAFP